MKIRFRVTGREAELWDPASGQIDPADYTIAGETTTVPLHLTERQSVFVIFRNNATVNSRNISQPAPVILDTLSGPWEISFPAGMGAPEKIITDSLKSWTVNGNEGVKYFSGTALYTKTFEASKSWLKDRTKLILDLGKVGDIAEVSINGTALGILWKAPFQADITGLLRKGTNKLEIKITNEWTNRLAGDQKASPGNKVLNSTLFVFPGRNLNDSGLLGPVTILEY